MKRLLIALLFCAVSASAQTTLTFPSLTSPNEFTGTNTFTQLNIYTIATLPAMGIVPGTFAIVSDGTTSADCSVGGGSSVSACIWTGSNWLSFGSGGGALVPGTTGNVIKYTNTTTGGDSGIAASSIAQKFDPTNASCFVSNTGNDSNSGLSWGAAKATPYACRTSLPNGSATNFIEGTGTIYIYGGTNPAGIAAGGPILGNGSFDILGGNDIHFNNAITSCTRVSNVVTCTFGSAHHYSIGQSIQVYNTTGGATSFNGVFTVASTPLTTTLTYAQTGGAESSTGGAALPTGFLKESGFGDLAIEGFGQYSPPNTSSWQQAIVVGGTGGNIGNATFALAGTQSHYSFHGISWRGCIPAAIGYDSNLSPTTNAGAFSTVWGNASFDIPFMNVIGCGPSVLIGPNTLWLKGDNFETSSLGGVAFTITSITRTSNVAVATLASGPGGSPTWQAGDKLSITGTSDPTFSTNSAFGLDGNANAFTVTSSSDNVHITYPNFGPDGTSTGGLVALDANNNRRAGILLNTNGGINVVDQFLNYWTQNDGGGYRVASPGPGSGSQLFGTHWNMEGSGISQPNYVVTVAPGPNANLLDIVYSDVNNNPCVAKVPRGSDPFLTNVELGPGQQAIPTCGPMRVINGATLSAIRSQEPNSSPLAKNQTGIFSSNVGGARGYLQIDDTRRSLAPVNVDFANLAQSTCGSWTNVTGGNLTLTTGISDVSHATTNACNLTMTVAGNGEADSYSANQTIKSGDGFIYGLWFQASSTAGVIPSFFLNGAGVLTFATATTRGVGQSIFGAGQGFLGIEQAQQEDGQWQWLMSWDSVNSANTTTGQNVKLKHFVANGYPENLYAPMLIHIPIASVSRYSLAISSVASGASRAIYTFGSPHQFLINQIVCINDVTDTSYNGCTQIVSVPSSTTIETIYNGGSTSSTGGTAYVTGDSEIAEIAQKLTAYSNSCTVGQFCNMAGAALTSASFSALTPGTNNNGAMVIGTGSSLTVSGSGTNNATTLNGATFAQPGTIGGTTPGVVNSTLAKLVEGSSPGGVSSTDLFYGLTATHWPAFNPNAAGEWNVCGSTGTLTSGHIPAFNTTGTQCQIVDGGTGTGSGTVTNFSANTITTGTQNFATAGVTSPGVTPALTYTLVNAPAHKTFMNNTGGSAAPDYESIGAADLPSTTVNVVANDTNVQGSISAQTLTLAWASTLSAARGGTSFASYTKGDTICPSGSTTLTKLGVGTNGQVLTAASGATCGIQWATPASTFTPQTNGVNNSTLTGINFTNTIGASGIDFTNPGTITESAILANVIGTGNTIPSVTVTGPQIGDYLAYTSGTLIANVTPGIVVNAQTGTSYSVSCVAGTGDRGALITFNNAAAIAVTVPNAATCPAGFYFNYRVIGAGAVTFTPTTSTVNGASTLIALGGQFGNFVSDNTNYQANRDGYASGTTGTIGGAIVGVGCDTGTVTINGAATTMVPVAVASTSGAPGAGLTVSAQVTSANTVTVSVCAPLTLTPTSSTYFVRLQE